MLKWQVAVEGVSIWRNQLDHPEHYLFRDSETSDFARFPLFDMPGYNSDQSMTVTIGFYFDWNIMGQEKTFGTKTINGENYVEACLTFEISEIYVIKNAKRYSDQGSRERRSAAEAATAILSLVGYIQQNYQNYRVNQRIDDIKKRVEKDELRQIELARITENVIEIVASHKQELLILQRQICSSEIQLEELKFDQYTFMLFSNFIMHVERTENAIANQMPNTHAQKLMIKVCSEINNSTEGCVQYYHRAHYELISTESTHKTTPMGQLRGVKFQISYSVPILRKITRVFGVLSNPVPLKMENTEYFYQS